MSGSLLSLSFAALLVSLGTAHEVSSKTTCFRYTFFYFTMSSCVTTWLRSAALVVRFAVRILAAADFFYLVTEAHKVGEADEPSSPTRILKE